MYPAFMHKKSLHTLIRSVTNFGKNHLLRQEGAKLIKLHCQELKQA